MTSYSRFWLSGLFSLIMLFLLSCSGGGGNPVAPGSLPSGEDLDPGITSSGDNSSDMGLTPGEGDFHAPQGDSSPNTVLGLYDISFDTATGQFDVVPARSAEVTINILKLLQPPGGDIANLKINIIDVSHLLSDGVVTVEFVITHPINDAKLACFDTMGVVIGNGGHTYDEDPAVKYGGPDDIQLLNFDGYTRWLNPVEFTAPTFFGYSEGFFGTKGVAWTATVNPYKYFSTWIGPTDELQPYFDSVNVENSRGVWQQGSTASRQYEIQFPMDGGLPVINFQYLILSHWALAVDSGGQPIPLPQPKNFPPDANAVEAVYITADPAGSNLFYNDLSGNSGGHLSLTLQIYDWQGLEMLGGTGAFDQIDSIGLGSPDGLFGGTGYLLDSTDLAGTEISSGKFSTTLSIVISDLEPQKSGVNEVFLAVYSEDPTGYGPLGTYPPDARLAAYTKFSVDVSQNDPFNEPPEINSIEGPVVVDCFESSALYTCNATDPNSFDTLQYKWDIVQVPLLPEFPDPYTDDPTVTIDWSSNGALPPGPYELWVAVSDGTLEVTSTLEISKLATQFKMGPITADDEFIHNVTCDIENATYQLTTAACEITMDPSFQWLRGPGEPPVHVNPLDPNWTPPSTDPFVVYDWNGTEIGQWWIITKLIAGTPIPQFGDYLIIERIDSQGTPLNPPSGATEVDCNSVAEEYQLTGGEDCDGGMPPGRSWAVSDSDVPPTDGWAPTFGNFCIIDWAPYAAGTWYVYQRLGEGENEEISDPRVVTRLNTPPEQPSIPFGAFVVTCSQTNEEYDAGDVFDCEHDELFREWALSDTDIPPETGWTEFTGKLFYIDWSTFVSGEYYLFQRASDDGLDWQVSLPAPVTKLNTPPGEPLPPTGPEIVACSDPIQEYDGGLASECDVEDEITRYWGATNDLILPPDTWTEFTGNTFLVDWTDFPTGSLFLYQRSVSGLDDQISPRLVVQKENVLPTVGLPTGPNSVDCSMLDAEYSISEIIDCDNTDWVTMWYLSSAPDSQVDGHWTPYFDPTFTVDYSLVPNGNWYLFIGVDDGFGQAITDPLSIVKNNSAPNKPDMPSGLEEVTCADSPAIYNSGDIIDCDLGDFTTSFYYFSTDPVTPTGGEWIQFLGGTIIIDFTGLTAEQPYYLFQKAFDGELETVSDPLAVVYHNSIPDLVFTPAGETDVSCSNDNEQYEGGPVHDCDTWQTLTRSYAISIADWPPATGWIGIDEDTWSVDWSAFDEGTYYMFQRVYDGFGYKYSEYLEITVGPPALVKPPTPVGSEDVVCDGSTETYDAGEYMTGCPGVDITREWAVGANPTPPLTGWTEFFGTSFLADPVDFGFGYVYLFQRATLDLDVSNSDALVVFVHPGSLGTPDQPSGSTSVDCNSINEPYDMGTVVAGCPDTPLTRSWQIQDAGGNPLTEWILFLTSPVSINWSTYNPGVNYRLIQRVSDGEKIQTSVPLVVTAVNSPPEFGDTISGETDVTCANHAEIYSCGVPTDCNHTQTLLHEWGVNSVNTPPVGGWQEVIGGMFIVDYSVAAIQPGNVYLFQRVSDGITTVYDPASLHVTYTNSPPSIPAPPTGNDLIQCANFLSTYDGGLVSDCDGTTLIREWAVADTDTPPVSGWTVYTGATFEVDWSVFGYGVHYLFQRVSDGEFAEASPSLTVVYINTPPFIPFIEADEGFGPFETDGLTSGYNGIDFISTLHFTFEVEDCDDDPLENRYAVTTSPLEPPFGSPEWSDPIVGTTFEIDFADYLAEAPAKLFIFFGSYDGTSSSSTLVGPPVNMWKRVWFTDFSDPGDMWIEDACVTGAGDYTWAYDGVDDYLRLTDYGAFSSAGVWSGDIAFPAASGAGYNGTIMTYLNPGMSDSSGLDNVSFSFLNAGCSIVPTSDFILGEGCDADNPGLNMILVEPGSLIWNNTYKLGLRMNGFDGCVDSSLFVDWVGFWEKPV